MFQAAVAELAAGTVRASSLVENLNSRLRSDFFLRRHLTPEFAATPTGSLFCIVITFFSKLKL